MANAGSIQEVSIRGRLFHVAADADASRKLGGFEKEAQPNGDGTVRYIMTRVPWSFTGLTLECDPARADQEFLQEIADQQEEVDITFTHVSGDTYQGKGSILDTLEFSTQNGTAECSFGGGGKLQQQ